MSESILRSTPAVPYTTIPNSIYSDTRLSNAARGLYGFMMSKPDGWSFSAVRIADQSKDGRDAVLSQMKQLEELGYLKRTKEPSGRVVYDLLDPKPENPDQARPKTGFSHRGEFRTISNKETSSNISLKEKKIKKEKGNDAIVVQEFLEMVRIKHGINKSKDASWMTFLRNDVRKMLHEGYDCDRLVRAIGIYRDNDFPFGIMTGKELSWHIVQIEVFLKKKFATGNSQEEKRGRAVDIMRKQEQPSMLPPELPTPEQILGK